MTLVHALQPREALLRHAANADQDPLWTAGECHAQQRGAGGNLLVDPAPFCCALFIVIGYGADVLNSCPFFLPRRRRAAWKVNQPTPVFAKVDDEEKKGDEEEA